MVRIALIAAVLLVCVSTLPAAGPPQRLTILYDAFGKNSNLQRDWGFAALVEYGDKRILFDTGNNADVFARNVERLRVDLKRLDAVVISHRHGDHTSGLNYLLAVNPAVTIYNPKEIFGVFGGSLPSSFYRRADSLPQEMRYFGGSPPEVIYNGTPWRQARFLAIDSVTEIASGIAVIPTISDTPGTRELRELSLSIRTPKGQVLLVGCSHAGVERVLDAARGESQHVHLIAGGLHLVTAPDPEIIRITTTLRERIDRIAPGHCTGEPAFAALRKTFAEAYVFAGLGATIDLP